MDNLHILITRHYDLDSTHYTKIWLESILPELSKFFSVKITWFCYFDEKIPDIPTVNNISVIQIQDFDNGMDVIRKIRPDLIIDNEFPTLIDLAFFVASRNQISFIRKWNFSYEIKSTFGNTLTGLSVLFQSTLPSTNQTHKKFMNRGRFFYKKYLFFIKTLVKSKLSLFEKFLYFYISVKWHLKGDDPFSHPKLQTDLELLNSDTLKQYLLKKNYSPSSLIVTGLPDLDSTIKKSKIIPSKNTKKLKILFAPTQIYEGHIFREVKIDLINKIIAPIVNSKSDFSLSVKLHPSSQNFDDYKKLIHAIDESIPIFQEGGIENHINNCDLFVSFGISSVFVYPLIAKKPIVVCDFLKSKDYFSTLTSGDEYKDLVFFCNDSKTLPQVLFTAYRDNPKKIPKIEKYLERTYYKLDGLSSERVVNAIKQLILQKK